MGLLDTNFVLPTRMADGDKLPTLTLQCFSRPSIPFQFLGFYNARTDNLQFRLSGPPGFVSKVGVSVEAQADCGCYKIKFKKRTVTSVAAAETEYLYVPLSVCLEDRRAVIPLSRVLRQNSVNVNNFPQEFLMLRLTVCITALRDEPNPSSQSNLESDDSLVLRIEAAKRERKRLKQELSDLRSKRVKEVSNSEAKGAKEVSNLEAKGVKEVINSEAKGGKEVLNSVAKRAKEVLLKSEAKGVKEVLNSEAKEVLNSEAKGTKEVLNSEAKEVLNSEAKGTKEVLNSEAKEVLNSEAKGTKEVLNSEAKGAKQVLNFEAKWAKEVKHDLCSKTEHKTPDFKSVSDLKVGRVKIPQAFEKEPGHLKPSQVKALKAFWQRPMTPSQVKWAKESLRQCSTTTTSNDSKVKSSSFLLPNSKKNVAHLQRQFSQ